MTPDPDIWYLMAEVVEPSDQLKSGAPAEWMAVSQCTEWAIEPIVKAEVNA